MFFEDWPVHHHFARFCLNDLNGLDGTIKHGSEKRAAFE
jgi:hypothetical protein